MARFPANAFIIPLLISSMVMGQDVENEIAAEDSIDASPIQWTQRIVVPVSQSDKRGLLYHPWDVWGHSDISATVDNPFVQADLMIGAALLDGSYGMPILTLATPAATQRRFENALDDPAVGPGGAITFRVLPMIDSELKRQTFMHWDQGDYHYRDVEVGAAIALDEQRSIVVSAQGISHPGPYNLSGTSSRYASQNYVLDYRSYLDNGLILGYTLLQQQEFAGLPYVDPDGQFTADRRISETWSQGLTANYQGESFGVALYGSGMSGKSQITDYSEQVNYFNRRTATTWYGFDAEYPLSESLLFTGGWHHKSREIDDGSLGYGKSIASNNGIMAHWLNESLGVGLGLSFGGGSAAVELEASIESRLGMLEFAYGGFDYLAYPYGERRRDADSTRFVTDAQPLEQIAISYSLSTERMMLGANAARFTGDFDGATMVGSGHLNYAIWPEIVQLAFSGSAMQTEANQSLPVRFNGFGSLTITAPFVNSRARPFASISGYYVGYDFTSWFDPRYGDLSLLIPLPDDPNAAIGWGTFEVGIKVRGFELRRGKINITNQNVQNSPEYLSPTGMNHYSISWQFFPGTKN